jgi:RND family efflux transporter MFP subunit
MMRLSLAGVAIALSSCHTPAAEHEEPLPVEVRCVPATRQPVDVTETLRGRVATPPGGDLPVASQVAGRVVQVTVHEGERVPSGFVVAVVDDSASQDALRQAEANLVQAKAAQTNSEVTLERVRQLVARGIAAKQELDDSLARADQARAAVNAASAASDLARRTLGRVQVRSTFEGIVTRVWRGAGALVDGTAATPLVQLAASTLAEFDVDATERQLAALAPGQSAQVRLAAGGEPIKGAVRTRSSALDPTTGLGFARIDLEPTQPLTLGVFGSATISVGTRDGVLVVPAAAMRGAVADGAEVVVCRGTTAEVRAVKVGWRGEDRVEIVSGLQEGEPVSVDHVLGLETGAPLVVTK